MDFYYRNHIRSVGFVDFCNLCLTGNDIARDKWVCDLG